MLSLLCLISWRLAQIESLKRGIPSYFGVVDIRLLKTLIRPFRLTVRLWMIGGG